VRDVRRAAVAGALALAVAAGCAHPGPPPEARRPAPEVGLASYYAASLEGRPTASGAPYDPRQMTCAHPRQPFGAVLRVTDVATGRSVRVRVTDRGPFAPGRVVDLSLAAARALGIVERGVARVEVERVE
jgi:rare lipoprotein A